MSPALLFPFFLFHSELMTASTLTHGNNTINISCTSVFLLGRQEEIQVWTKMKRWECCLFSLSCSISFWFICVRVNLVNSVSCRSLIWDVSFTAAYRRFTRLADFQMSRTCLRWLWPIVSGSFHTETPHDCARRLASIEMSHFVRCRKKRPGRCALKMLRIVMILPSFQYNKNVPPW